MTASSSKYTIFLIKIYIKEKTKSPSIYPSLLNASKSSSLSSLANWKFISIFEISLSESQISLSLSRSFTLRTHQPDRSSLCNVYWFRVQDPLTLFLRLIKSVLFLDSLSQTAIPRLFIRREPKNGGGAFDAAPHQHHHRNGGVPNRLLRRQEIVSFGFRFLAEAFGTSSHSRLGPSPCSPSLPALRSVLSLRIS